MAKKETHYGVRYADGTEDWDTPSWFGHIETPEMRASFQEQYALRLKALGVVPAPELTFLTRTVSITQGTPKPIDDTVEDETTEEA